MINADIVKNKYTGNGSLLSYPVTFPFSSDDDLAVYVSIDDVETQYFLGTHYSVAVNSDNSGGTVTFVNATLVPQGSIIAILLSLAQTQDVDLTSTAIVSTPDLEAGLDKTVQLVQMLSERVDRCVTVGPTSAASGSDLALGTVLESVDTKAAAAMAAMTAAQSSQTAADASASAAQAAQSAAEAARDEAHAIAIENLPMAGSVLAGILKTASAASILAGTATDEAATPAALGGAASSVPAANAFVRTAGTANLNGWVTDTTNATTTAAGSTMPRAMAARMAELHSVRDFGATGLGAVDERSAIAAADAVYADLYFPAGTYYIAGNATISRDVRMAPGAKFVVASGATLTLAGELTAGLTQIFDGVGTVSLNRKKNPIGHPEWWGAVMSETYDATQAATNLAAVQASLAAARTTVLQSGTLWTSGTITMATGQQRLIGQGEDFTATHGTRIVVANGTDDVLHLGPDTMPSAVNNFPSGIRVKDIMLHRAVAPVAPVSGSEAAAPCGLKAKYALRMRLSHIQTYDSSIGFYFGGIVGSTIDDCYNIRATAGSGTGRDISWGFFLDGYSGTAPVLLAGGNGSIYINRCSANSGSPSNVNNIGMLGKGYLADTFVTQFEVAGGQYGVMFNGVNTQYGGNDITLRGCRVDAISKYAYDFEDNLGQITLIDNYGATDGTLNSMCYRFVTCVGTIGGSGNQAPALGQSCTYGVVISNCVGFDLSAFLIRDCWIPIWIQGSQGISGSPLIHGSDSMADAEGLPAIYITDASNRCFINPTIMGSNTKKWGAGVGVTSDCTGLEINVSAIFPAVVNTHKLIYGSTVIGAAGSFGSNLATGAFS